MKRERCRLGVVAAACCLLAALPAAGVFASIDSIEAMVADADVVAVVTAGDTWPVAHGTKGPRGRLVLRVQEVIKGDAPAEFTVVVPTFFEAEVMSWKRQGGRRRLAFLVHTPRAPWHPEGTGYPLALRTYGWTLPDSTYLASDPAQLFAGGFQVPANLPKTAIAFTVDLRPIFGLDDAIAAARESAARTIAGATRYVELEAPEHGELWQVAPMVRNNWVRIPVDDRAEAAARRWAEDPACAEQAVKVLCHFDSDRNAAILTRFLDHPAHESSGRPGKMVTWNYPVRAQAARALERWGPAPRSVAVRGPDDFYRPLGWRHLWVGVGCMVGLAGLTWLLRRRRRRPAPVEGNAAATVVPPPRRRMPVYSMCLAVLFVGLLWLDRTSRRSVHEVTVSLGDSRYWFSSYEGGLQFVRVNNWPRRRELSYGRFDLRDAPRSLWNEDDVFPTADHRLAGFRRLRGSMWGDDLGATYPYGSFTVPTALVAALVALLPAWHVVAFMHDRSRRRGWAARGCCIACGYDLRGIAATAGAPCPECGSKAIVHEAGPERPQARGSIDRAPGLES